MDFLMRIKSGGRVKTLPTHIANLVLSFQMILANMTLQLVLSWVAFPADVTEMGDTFISGFFSQVDDVDVILQG